MQSFTPEQIEQYAELYASSFLDDPRNQALYAGIGHPMELAKQLYQLEIEEMARENAVYPLDTRGILIGYRSTEVSRLKLLLHNWHMAKRLRNLVDPQTLSQLRENERRIKPVDNYRWYRKYAGKDYFHITDLAVSKGARGTGAFRQMIEPHLQRAQQQGIPVVLETHNPNNVPLYEYFGFQVVKIFEDARLPYKQYCFVKQP